MKYSIKKKKKKKSRRRLRSRRNRNEPRMMKVGIEITVKSIIKPKKYKKLKVYSTITIADLKTQIAKELSLPSV